MRVLHMLCIRTRVHVVDIILLRRTTNKCLVCACVLPIYFKETYFFYCLMLKYHMQPYPTYIS